jgi:NAD(P)H-flavin reductase
MPTGAMVPDLWTVRHVARETHDTTTLTVEPAGPAPPAAAYRPGQFSMLWVFGVGEVPVSMSGDPADPRTLVYTVRAVGPGSRALVGLAPGGTIGVRGPFGAGWPVDAAEGRDVLIVAGGVGLAPLRGAIYHVRRHRDRYGRLALVYGARSPRDVLYRRELRAWTREAGCEVLVTVDHGGPGWRGPVGVVTRLLDRLRLEPGRTVAMICGPEVMMRFAPPGTWNTSGWAAARCSSRWSAT